MPPIKDLEKFFEKTYPTPFARNVDAKALRDEFARAALIAVACNCKFESDPADIAFDAVKMADQVIYLLDRPKP